MHDGAKQLRVLIIEDDADLRDALCDALHACGHVVTTAVDGSDGLLQLRTVQPDVVVLDLMMPKLDGWQFRIAQRRDPMLATTPVVAISANGSATAAAVDADLFLRKPLDAETLCRAIEDAVAVRAKQLAPAKIAEVDRLATLGTLAAGLAHEINNPLTYLLIQLGLVVRGLRALGGDGDDPRVQELETHARGAMEGAERIRGIMTGIRTFSRIDGTSMKPIDIRVPIEAALKLVANELRHRARLVEHYSDPPLVMANEGRLGQVFLNLFTNALHALPEGSAPDHELRVHAAADSEGNLLVEVGDSGAGIQPHILPRVFEPYFSTKPVAQGTGLGLSISRNIVSSHGGTIGVTSEPGRGTTFQITLPGLRRRSSRGSDAG